MGLGKSFKKAIKKVSKAVKQVVSTAVDITIGIVSGEYLAKATGKILSFVGEKVVDDVFGLDDIGHEISNIGVDITQVGKVLGGDYHDDAKKIQEMELKLQTRIDTYNLGLDELYDRLDDLIAFHEIFQMAMSNRIDNYQEIYEPELKRLMTEYELAVQRLKDEYDFVIGLTQGAFLQRLVGSIIMIIGGIMSDFKDVMNGSANGETWRRLITSIISVIGVIALFFVPGLQGVALAVAVSLAAIATFMALDGMYSNGAATGAIMGLLDFIFTDLLNLDDLIGKDFDKFDKDHEDYQQMVMITQLSLSLASVSVAWANGASIGSSTVQESQAPTFNDTMRLPSEGGIENTITTKSAFQVNNTTTFLGIPKTTYSNIYKAYNAASSVKDVLNQKQAYDAMIEKFTEDRLTLESLLTNSYRKNFIKHYKDTAYFLQDQQEYIDRYVWGMTSQSLYVDPYGTTPVANIRFTPDKDTRMLSFGFEDIFDESRQAGSKAYFDTILYEV